MPPNPAISQRVSDQLRIMGLVSMILVLYVHAYSAEVRFRGATLVEHDPLRLFLENFVSRGLGDVAVPWFFAISGWLFFRNVDWSAFRASHFRRNLRARLRTLLLPYLVWNLAWMGLFFAVQAIGATSQFFTHTPLADLGLDGLLASIFVRPIPYQFWFVRDLMLLCLGAPLIYLAVRFAGLGFVLATFAFWMISPSPGVLRSESLAFFTVGAFAARSGVHTIGFEGARALPLAVAGWLVTACLSSLPLGLEEQARWILHCLNVLAGMAGFYALGKHMALGEGVMHRAAREAFLLYAAHEPLLTGLKKLAFARFFSFERFGLLVYFAIPAALVVLLTFAGSVLRERMPALHGVLTGYR